MGEEILYPLNTIESELFVPHVFSFKWLTQVDASSLLFRSYMTSSEPDLEILEPLLTTKEATKRNFLVSMSFFDYVARYGSFCNGTR
jgi:hypothetical protein